MIKIVMLFLAAVIVLALFGKLRLLGSIGRAAGLPKPGKCPACGRYRIGRGPCPCGRR